MDRKKAEAIYTEESSAGNGYRVQYREDILALIERRQKELYAQRDAFGKQLMASGRGADLSARCASNTAIRSRLYTWSKAARRNLRAWKRTTRARRRI